MGWDPVGFAEWAGRARALPAERSEENKWGGTQSALPSGRGGRVPSPLSAAKMTGAWMVMLSAVCFSAKAIFAKLAYRYGADASTVLGLRMAFALPFFALFAARGGRQSGAARFT